jgi:outer membrane protein assembly factor BamB
VGSKKARQLLGVLSTWLLVCQAYGAQNSGPRTYNELARHILKSAGVKAGLCVHLGYTDGKLTAALAKESNLLVHGLTWDRMHADSARRYIQEEEIYGRVSVDQGSYGRLPYADNLVNLVVVDDLLALLNDGLSIAEVMRVLCPGGIACLGQSPEGAADSSKLSENQLRLLLREAGLTDLELIYGQGTWAKVHKARPEGMDQWTHKNYDASSNCVSRDDVVAPLSSVRWIAGPTWPMGTGYQVSNGGVVSANGRVFTVTLNVVANFKKTPQERDHQWFLVARDAYNGMLLWQRPFQMNILRDGQEFADALIAVGDRLYVVLEGKTLAVDAASGKTVATFAEDTPVGTRLLCLQGLVMVATKDRIRALDAASGKPRWEKQQASQDIIAGDGQLFYTTPHQRELVCLDLYSGEQRWRTDLSAIVGFKEQLLFYQSGVLVFVWELDWRKGHNGIAVFDAHEGSKLWNSEYVSSRATWANTVWFVDGLIWHRIDKAGLQAVNPRTGAVERTVTMQGSYCGGCCRDIATVRYAVGTRPLNFFDWKDGSCLGFRGGRHACRAGVIVANGLLYTLPHGCKCVRESLRGYIAFAPSAETDKKDVQVEAGDRLERAEEIGTQREESDVSRGRDWPTFRHDAWRTSSTPCEVPAELRLDWQAPICKPRTPRSPLADEWQANPLGGDGLTAPVVAGGKAFVGVVDEQRVVSLDSKTGELLWSFTTGGRLDTPPTVHQGLCLAGAHDGRVYCLRASDGKLVWSFRAAPLEKRILAFGQLESPWPVLGGVMVEDNTAYFAAGRYSVADGGIHGYALDVATGEVKWHSKLDAAQSDLLVREGGAFRMAGGGSAGIKFDLKTGERLPSTISPEFTWIYGGKMQSFWAGPNRAIDRSWRILSVNETASHWMRIKQGYGPHEGQLVIAAPDQKRYFAYRFKQVHWSKAKNADTEFGGYLVAWKGTEQLWSVEVPEDFQVEALVLAGDLLFAAGASDRFHPSEGGRLWVLSAQDGKQLREYKLDSPPVCEGLAVAEGKLYLATQDGKLLCFGKQ